MPDTYKLQYDGMTLTYPNWNGYVSYEAAPAFKTLTLYHSEGGTLTASTLTAYPGDTINLSTAYDTYWRFSGYQLTGDGSLVGNDYTFGTEDATICACFKPNAFTATGGFEKGSNVTCYLGQGGSKTTVVPLKYAVTGYKTSNVPSSWYATSNRWNPSNASAYSITLKPYMRFTAYSNGAISNVYCTACSYVNGSYQQSQSYSMGKGNSTWNYNKNFTITTQGNCGISAKMSISDGGSRCGCTYIATATTGTWTATGYAP